MALTRREFSRMGIIGPQDSYERGWDTVTVFPSMMALLDLDSAQQIDVAKPGDTVVITSEVTLSPIQTMVQGEYHPKLYDFGIVSGPRVFYPDYSGRLQVMLGVVKEFRLDHIPYLIRLVSMGEVK